MQLSRITRLYGRITQAKNRILGQRPKAGSFTSCPADSERISRRMDATHTGGIRARCSLFARNRAVDEETLFVLIYRASVSTRVQYNAGNIRHALCSFNTSSL